MSTLKIVCLMLIYCGVSFANTTVNIICDEEDATLYVNGEKRVKITQKKTPIELTKGSYELMLTKPLDEDWRLVGRKNIAIKDAMSMDVKLSMDIEKISKKKNKSSADNFHRKGEVVIDSIRKLVWQDDASVAQVKQNWKDAQAYCRSLTLDHANDWRLPSYDELITIVDYTKHTLAIMPAFKHIVSEYYWSSNVDAEHTANVKNIYFGNGCPDNKAKKNLYYTRCVHILK